MTNGTLVNRKVRESFVRNFGSDIPARAILAVSGGPDSQAVLKVLPHVVPECKFQAVGINHGLRPEADSELNLAESLADSVGVKFERIKLKIDVNPGDSLQAVAREARYSALLGKADEFGAQFVITGHHADDKAETFLIRLVRGKCLGSLAVMPEVSGRIFRPLLQISKEEIMSYLDFWKVRYASDPSNENLDFLRVWVRKELMPQLHSKNPKIVQRINGAVDELLKINELSQ